MMERNHSGPRHRRHDNDKRRRGRTHSRSRSRSQERRRKRHHRDRDGKKRENSKDKRESRARPGAVGISRSRSPNRSDCQRVRRSFSYNSDLPVFDYKDEFMGMIKKNQVIVCTGETGSGKTTQLPQYLLDGLLEEEREQGRGGGGVVCVTQPRRVAAMSVARRVAEERGRGRCGGEVGYAVRFEDRTTPGVTRLKYVTDGTLVRECLADPLLRQYSVVMLDEAHERSLHTDILFGLLKQALAARPGLRALVTSATLDVARFSGYFGGCPVLQIPGRTHPVDIYHSKTKQVMTASGPASKAYVDSVVEIIQKIHSTQGEGHVLAFLTGQDEIERACAALREGGAAAAAAREETAAAEAGITELKVLPLYGSLLADRQRSVFADVPPNVRKVVVATNIAETSVTVPGVRFVVDAGYVKQKAYDPGRRMESLVVVPISKVAAQQRSGRAGRTGPGQCYRLYSSLCYDEMMQETVPEIRRCGMANTVLHLKVLGIRDVLRFDYFEAPDADQLGEALVALAALGALDADGQVTELGRRMAGFPLDPPLARMVVEASARGCAREVAAIAGMLSSESVWFTRGDRRSKDGGSGRDEEALAAHELFHHPQGDHLTYLKLFKAWELNGASEDFCQKYFIRFRALRTAKNIKNQIENEVRKSGLNLNREDNNDVNAILKSICSGLVGNAARRSMGGAGVYRNLPFHGGAAAAAAASLEGVKVVHLHPGGALVGAEPAPEVVVYQDLVFTAKAFIRHVSAVKLSWLEKFRGKVEVPNIDRLCGRNLDGGGDKQQQEDSEQQQSEHQGVDDNNLISSEGNSKAGKRAGTEALSAAKQRYLQRKKEAALGRK